MDTTLSMFVLGCLTGLVFAAAIWIIYDYQREAEIREELREKFSWQKRTIKRDANCMIAYRPEAGVSDEEVEEVINFMERALSGKVNVFVLPADGDVSAVRIDLSDEGDDGA